MIRVAWNYADAIAKIGARKVIVSLSGGKDSAAAALHLRELGIPVDAYVFSDTGWEHRSTYDHIAGALTDAFGPITTVRAEIPLFPGFEESILDIEAMLDPDGARSGCGARPSPMVRLCVWKGCFPGQDVGWCTQNVKMVPTARLFASIDADIVNVVGIRRGESANRALALEWEEMESIQNDPPGRLEGEPVRIDVSHVEQARPLVDWSVGDVVEIHARHALPLAPLYRLGAGRVGCWPCKYARKDDVRIMAEIDPERVDVILPKLERVVGRRASERKEAVAERKGAVVDPLPPPTWFQVRDELSYLALVEEYPAIAAPRRAGWRAVVDAEGSEATAAKDRHYCIPIEKVVAWARTARGGRQLPMFEPPTRDWACSRWGFCETRPTEPK